MKGAVCVVVYKSVNENLGGQGSPFRKPKPKAANSKKKNEEKLRSQLSENLKL
jgi:hypothetical protein